MLSEAQRRQYFDEGYIILENFLTEEELNQITVRLDAFDEAHNKELQNIVINGIYRANEITFTSNLVKRDPALEQFVSSAKFVSLTTELLGPDIKLYWDQTVYKRPEARRDFPWHQDTGYVPTDPAHYVTCWIPLFDATVDNGCIWIQPRSHLNGMAEHKWTDIGWQCYFAEDPGLAVPLKRGSIAAFSSLLFHRSGPNLSNDTRKAYVVQFSVEHAKHANTGVEFDNGPVIAHGNDPVIGLPLGSRSEPVGSFGSIDSRGPVDAQLNEN